MSLGLYRLPFHADETAAGFCSRFAALNGVRAHSFCIDMGFRFTQILNAEENALAELSALASVSLQSLTRNAIKRLSKNHLVVRGEQGRAPFFRSGVTRACPHCLADDRKKSSLPSPEYIRIHWHNRFIRACPIHKAPIIDLVEGARNVEAAVVIENNALLIHKASLSDKERHFTSFEQFVLDRLEGKREHGDFLDGLSLNAAADLCELVGLLTKFGREALIDSIPDEEWHAGSALGFERLALGTEELVLFAEELTSDINWRRFQGNGNGLFGEFYRKLTRRVRSPGYESVVDILFQFVEERLTVPDGTFLFGRRVSSKHQSVYAAPKGTDRIFRTILSSLSVDAPQDATVFSADETHKARTLLDALVTRKEAEKILGLPQDLFRQVCDLGFLEPDSQYSQLRGGQGNTRYSRQAIDSFLQSLRIDNPCEHRDGLAQLKKAPGITALPVGVIIGMIRDGKLKTVFYDESESGCNQIYVSPSEIKLLSAKPDYLLESSEAAAYIGWKVHAFGVLVRHHLMKPEPKDLRFLGFRPRTYFFHVRTLDDFIASWITCKQLTLQFGIPHVDIRIALRKAGLEPVEFERNVIFERAKAEKVMAEFSKAWASSEAVKSGRSASIHAQPLRAVRRRSGGRPAMRHACN